MMKKQIPNNTTIDLCGRLTVTKKTHGFRRYITLCGMAYLLATLGSASAAQDNSASAAQDKKASASEVRSSRLVLKLVKTEALPVIGTQHPDTQDIRGGFEAGTTVKLSIDGKTAYHMVTSTLETVGWKRLRTEHWTSEDGMNWARHKVLFRPRHHPETSLWELTGSPFFFFDESKNRWYIYFNYMASLR